MESNNTLILTFEELKELIKQVNKKDETTLITFEVVDNNGRN